MEPTLSGPTFGDEKYLFIHLNLTPDGRKALGTALAKKHHKEISINFLGREVNAFFADADTARAFADGTHRANFLPDFSLSVAETGLFVGFGVFTSLNNGDPLVSCDSEKPLSDFEPYAAFLGYIERIKENYNEHKKSAKNK